MPFTKYFIVHDFQVKFHDIAFLSYRDNLTPNFIKIMAVVKILWPLDC